MSDVVCLSGGMSPWPSAGIGCVAAGHLAYAGRQLRPTRSHPAPSQGGSLFPSPMSLSFRVNCDQFTKRSQPVAVSCVPTMTIELRPSHGLRWGSAADFYGTTTQEARTRTPRDCRNFRLESRWRNGVGLCCGRRVRHPGLVRLFAHTCRDGRCLFDASLDHGSGVWVDLRR